MLNSILVPLDGSALAETALPYALRIVEDGGRLTLLMVIDETPIVEDSPLFMNTSDNVVSQPQLEESLKHTEDYLARVAGTLNKSNLTIETMALHGKPAGEIVDISQNSPMDAIVMSTHGRTGLSRWILGSVTQKVISASRCPVFVVPSKD
jgi:nucleotide-binding universal stress UspA family protein